jgi:hypothetical protein
MVEHIQAKLWGGESRTRRVHSRLDCVIGGAKLLISNSPFPLSE